MTVHGKTTTGYFCPLVFIMLPSKTSAIDDKTFEALKLLQNSLNPSISNAQHSLDIPPSLFLNLCTLSLSLFLFLSLSLSHSLCLFLSPSLCITFYLCSLFSIYISPTFSLSFLCLIPHRFSI